MSVFEKGTNEALTPQLEAKALFEEAAKDTLMMKFHGSVVEERTEMLNQKGDSYNYGLNAKVSSAGVQNYETLVGKEVALSTYSDTVTVNYIRNAFQYDKKQSIQRASFDIPSETRRAAKRWLTEKLEEIHFDALTAASNPLTIHNVSGTFTIQNGDRATAAGNITSADILEPDLLMELRPVLSTGRNGAQPKIAGYMHRGRPYYVVVQHPDALVDLKKDSKYAQYVREAHVRGEENPIFTGAVAIIDGFVIHESEYIDATTTANVSRGYVLGEDALCWMWSMRPNMYISDDNSDHGRKESLIVEFGAGVNATEFNNLPYGYMDLFVYAGGYSTVTLT